MTDNVKPLFGKAAAPARPEPPAPDPVPLEPEYTSADFDAFWLPDPVRLWVEACSAAYGVPRAMPIAAAMCAAATLVQGKVQVEIRPGWREPLSLFWLVFSPTGSRKSALLRAATAPVRALQAALDRDLQPTIRQRTNERARLELQIARMRRATKAHAYTEGAQEHMAQLRELEHELSVCEVPLVPRWLFDDINPTMVPRKLRHNQEAEGIARLAVLDAEGTFLANLLGRHSGHVNVDPLLKGYGGEPIDMVRAIHGSANTQDVHLDAAHLTLLLLVQPHYLDQVKSQPTLASNGFLGRCLMTSLEHSQQEVPWDAPAVPESVQDGYARWLAQLNAIEPGTVWHMPAIAHPELKRLHELLERDRIDGKGAVGWTVRTLGRLCRLVALSELGTVALSQPVAASQGGAGGISHTRVITKITYLYNLLYSRALAQARALEPDASPLPRLTRRALTWLRQATVATVTLRRLCNALHLKKDQGLAVCDSLVETGHLEMLAPVQRSNRTLTVAYRVLSTEAEPALQQAKPFLAQVPAGQTFDDLEPDDPGPEPDFGDLL